MAVCLVPSPVLLCLSRISRLIHQLVEQSLAPADHLTFVVCTGLRTLISVSSHSSRSNSGLLSSHIHSSTRRKPGAACSLQCDRIFAGSVTTSLSPPKLLHVTCTYGRCLDGSSSGGVPRALDGTPRLAHDTHGAERIGPSGRLENMLRITAVGAMLLGATAALAQKPLGRGRRSAGQPAACEGGAAPRRRPSPMTARSRPVRRTLPASRSGAGRRAEADRHRLLQRHHQAACRPRPRSWARSTVTTDGPTQANIDEQITFIDNYITRGVNGILFAANDPVAIAPVLKKALGKGIHVIGYDANASPTRASGSSTRPSSTASARPWSTTWPRRSARTAASPSSPRPSPRPTRRAGSPRCRPTRRSATRT